ncbi:hypothetical protein GMRT_12199 [Giardia muris]|uniref:Uncharacterized protein n=1 Tax=Giardia muris TaxID=5742 RepID=A0A4Z1T435_GIAMU|nr:hypothetical protein GMRT_12199 [Giardia muris]|eukprot:TNJ27807.1 hypothetical protein GMRT_12199 [Giardia muris]
MDELGPLPSLQELVTNIRYAEGRLLARPGLFYYNQGLTVEHVPTVLNHLDKAKLAFTLAEKVESDTYLAELFPPDVVELLQPQFVSLRGFDLPDSLSHWRGAAGIVIRNPLTPRSFEEQALTVQIISRSASMLLPSTEECASCGHDENLSPEIQARPGLSPMRHMAHGDDDPITSNSDSHHSQSPKKKRLQNAQPTSLRTPIPASQCLSGLLLADSKPNMKRDDLLTELFPMSSLAPGCEVILSSASSSPAVISPRIPSANVILSPDRSFSSQEISSGIRPEPRTAIPGARRTLSDTLREVLKESQTEVQRRAGLRQLHTEIATVIRRCASQSNVCNTSLSLSTLARRAALQPDSNGRKQAFSGGFEAVRQRFADNLQTDTPLATVFADLTPFKRELRNRSLESHFVFDQHIDGVLVANAKDDSMILYLTPAEEQSTVRTVDTLDGLYHQGACMRQNYSARLGSRSYMARARSAQSIARILSASGSTEHEAIARALPDHFGTHSILSTTLCAKDTRKPVHRRAILVPETVHQLSPIAAHHSISQKAMELSATRLLSHAPRRGPGSGSSGPQRTVSQGATHRVTGLQSERARPNTRAVAHEPQRISTPSGETVRRQGKTISICGPTVPVSAGCNRKLPGLFGRPRR